MQPMCYLLYVNYEIVGLQNTNIVDDVTGCHVV